MLSSFISLIKTISRPTDESWDLTVLLFHTLLLDLGFVPLPPDSSSGSHEILQSGSDGSVNRCILPSGWKKENGLFKFRYFHPRTTPLLSPKRICEMNAIVDGDDLKVTVTGGGFIFTPSFDSSEGLANEMTISKDQRLGIEVYDTARSITSSSESIPPVLIATEFMAQNFVETCRPILRRTQLSGGVGAEHDDPEEFQQQRPKRLLERPTTAEGYRSEDVPFLCPAPGRPRSDLDPVGPQLDPLRDWRPQGVFQPDGNLIGPNHPGFGRTRAFSGQPAFGIRTGEPDPDHEPVPGGRRFGYSPDMFM